MRNMTYLRAGCLFGMLIGLTLAGRASAQQFYSPSASGACVRGGAAYPYDYIANSCLSYEKAVRFGCVPVAPPLRTLRRPTDYFCPFYFGPPYYAYLKSQAPYSELEGVPNGYEPYVPPPIPTPSSQPTDCRQPSASSPEELPMPPAPSAEPTPPQSKPAAKPVPAATPKNLGKRF